MLTIFTSMLMHAGWSHLFGNMLFLWVFGQAIENALGSRNYQETGKFLSKYDLTALFKGRGGAFVPATTVQCLADRLYKAKR